MDHSVIPELSDEPLDDSSLRESARELAKANSVIAASAIVRPVTFDNLSDVRYLHAQSIKNLASGEFSDEEVAATKALVYSPKYLDALGAAISRKQFFGAWIGEALVGTAGWSVLDETTTVARIRSIFVSPLYSRMGLAQKLLAHVEGEAAEAGLRTFSVRSMANANGFFLRQGYKVTSHGVRLLFPDRSVPVTFLRKTWNVDLLLAAV
jgi:GNAT superfamily N-acetyltransferase